MQKFILAICLALFMAGCTSTNSSLENTSGDTPTQAIIVLQQRSYIADIFGQRGKATVSIALYGNNGKSYESVCKFPFCMPDEVHVLVVDPGTYRYGYLSVPMIDHSRKKVPVRHSPEVTVKAGEVVYIGSVEIDVSERTGYRTVKVDRRIVDDAAAARTTLSKTRPELADRMIVRLMHEQSDSPTYNPL